MNKLKQKYVIMPIDGLCIDLSDPDQALNYITKALSTAINEEVSTTKRLSHIIVKVEFYEQLHEAA